MPNTTYNLISRAFEKNESNSPTQRIKLSSPKLTIDAHRLRTKNNTTLLNEVWLKIKTEMAITKAQIEAALKLREKNSKIMKVAKTIFTTTQSIQQQIAFIDLVDLYIADSENLCSLNDQTPII